jgi:hypothetical protein
MENADSSSSCDEGTRKQSKIAKPTSTKTALQVPASRTSSRVKARGVGSLSEVSKFALPLSGMH